jgi:hypothetical protein
MNDGTKSSLLDTPPLPLLQPETRRLQQCFFYFWQRALDFDLYVFKATSRKNPKTGYGSFLPQPT